MKLHLLILGPLLALLVGQTTANAEEPSVGDIFDIEPGSQFRSWNLQESGTSDAKASYAIFEKDGVRLIAITKPLLRRPTGGVEVEKIVYTEKISIPKGEELFTGSDCSFLYLSPAIVHYNKLSKIATGYFVFGEVIEIRRWLVDDPLLCQYGGD